MNTHIKKLHTLINEGKNIEAQTLLRIMIRRLPDNDVLSKSYLLKAYEINLNGKSPFSGISSKQLEAHSLLIRQLLIENEEELNRRVSRTF